MTVNLEIEPKWNSFPPEVGWVCVIEAGGMYKIGLSRNIGSRIKSLQTACPFPITLVCKYFAHENAAWTEADFHSLAVDGDEGSWRLHGEWFHLSQASIDNLKSICDSQLIQNHSVGLPN